LQKYFTKKEFNKAVKDSFKPLDIIKTNLKVGTGDEKHDIGESDSEPSIDNYDLQDIVGQYESIIDEKEMQNLN
tara:strand:- start:1685 stop:1906 length:222 start_codon:yes stop_codon:yes gene_type:complete